MKKVFITGATGFIGQKLILSLLKRQIEIYALALPNEADRLSENSMLHIILGNLDQSDEIEKQMEGIVFDVMFHLAWTGVSSTYKNDASIQIKNIPFALKVMEIAKLHGCHHVVCTGSVSEYAYVETAVNGKQLPCPSDMYSATKSAVHIFCDLFARQHGINFNWILIPSIYGPGRNDNNLITYTIKMLLAGKKPSFTRLEQKWDYIYIDDLILTLVLVAEYGKENKVYVTGSGIARPMYEYVEIIKNKIDSKAELGIGEIPYKTDKIDHAVTDIIELKKDTGYEPLISFEEGICKTIDYFKEMLEGEV